jgi:hypothetical protein
MTDADVAGIPTEFEWRGHTYQVHPRSLRMELLLSAWAEGRAAAVVRRHRDSLGEDGYREALDGWRRDCGAGLYEFGSPLCQRAIFSRAGIAHQIYLKMLRGDQGPRNGVPRPPVTPKLVEDILADPARGKELIDLLMSQDWPDPEGEEGEEGEDGGEGGAKNEGAPAGQPAGGA